MNNKNIYHELCKTEKAIPIFSKDWWLDAVCGPENWDVIVIKRGAEIAATLPYYIKRSKMFSIITMPMLTQTMGPYIKYPEYKRHEKQLSYEKEVMTELISKLPKYSYFHQNLHYSITNWLPFYWNGFSQTTRYTYVIEDLSNLENVWAQFSHAKRKNIKKAENKIKVLFDLSAKNFYENHKQTLAKQGKKIVYTFELFKKIYTAGYNHKSAKTIYAADMDGNIHAALFVVWDSQSAYDLISTIDPDYRNSGAASLLVKEIIKYVSNLTNKFDFEGSMIENVENSFRQFGAVQKPYFSVSRIDSRILRIKQGLGLIIRGILDK
ncbi:MAG TPA: GNAT family N-acetyltransferase [Paludibacter sp.]|nr:GNAT family N-acetyltransferase [Paludibacter sp.]